MGEHVVDASITQTVEFWSKIKVLFQPEFLTKVALILGAIFFLWLVYFALKKIFMRLPEDKIKPQIRDVVLKIMKYVFEILVVIYIFNLFGISLSALFGAAGIAGVAIGLAAQTSLGNIISGVFMMYEHMFKIGDHIQIEEIEGNVESIDLLSVKIKTFDNQIVRVPNETIIKTNLLNYSSMKNRRICLYTQIDYDKNMDDVMPLILETVKKTGGVLSKPVSEVICTAFGDNGIEIRITAWTKYADYLNTRSRIVTNVNEACKNNGIKIMYPVVELHQEENTKIKN